MASCVDSAVSLEHANRHTKSGYRGIQVTSDDAALRWTPVLSGYPETLSQFSAPQIVATAGNIIHHTDELTATYQEAG